MEQTGFIIKIFMELNNLDLLIKASIIFGVFCFSIGAPVLLGLMIWKAPEFLQVWKENNKE